MGAFIAFAILLMILTKAWWIILLICAAGLLHAGYHASREEAQKRAHTRRVHEAGLARRIARRQRDIARTDAALGLGSAPLSAVNADTLERLARADAKVN